MERRVFLTMALPVYRVVRHRNSAAFISMKNKLPFTFSLFFFGIIYNNWKWNMMVNWYLHTTEIKLMRQGTADLMRIIGSKIFESKPKVLIVL